LSEVHTFCQEPAIVLTGPGHQKA